MILFLSIILVQQVLAVVELAPKIFPTPELAGCVVLFKIDDVSHRAVKDTASSFRVIWDRNLDQVNCQNLLDLVPVIDVSLELHNIGRHFLPFFLLGLLAFEHHFPRECACVNLVDHTLVVINLDYCGFSARVTFVSIVDRLNERFNLHDLNCGPGWQVLERIPMLILHHPQPFLDVVVYPKSERLTQALFDLCHR